MIEVKEGLATLDLTKKSPADVYEVLQVLLAARLQLHQSGWTVTVKKKRTTPKKTRKTQTA
jgi:hypothetical protein